MTTFAISVFNAYNNTMNNAYRTPIDACFINQKIQNPYQMMPLFESINSTSTYIKDTISELNHGTIIIAKHQSMGRGRYERKFESNKDVGIYCSFLLKDQITTNLLNLIHLKIVCALQYSIKQVFKVDTQIKWPNDLMINNRKCAGILIETNINMNTAKCDGLIIGFGLNIYKQNFTNSLKENATTLEDHSTFDLDRNKLIVHFFNHLHEFLYHTDIIPYYKKYMLPINSWVNLTLYNKKELVKIVDLDEYGQLIIQTKTNSLLTLFNDEITL